MRSGEGYKIFVAQGQVWTIDLKRKTLVNVNGEWFCKTERGESWGSYES